MRSNKAARQVAAYGMLIGLAFIFSYLEAILPLPIPIPGVKLGLANLVTIVGLYTVGIPGTAAVSLVRILLAGFTFGNMFSIIYSLAGGALSLVLMVIVRKTGWFDQIGVSIVGGVGHNIGQLAVAAFVTRTAGVFYYLPFLMVAGCVAGGLIGLLGGLVTERIGGLGGRLQEGRGAGKAAGRAQVTGSPKKTGTGRKTADGSAANRQQSGGKPQAADRLQVTGSPQKNRHRTEDG